MKQYGIGKATVLGILDKAGVTRRQRRATPAQMQEAATLYADGWSLVRIGEYLGFEDATVWFVAQAARVPMRKPWERLKEPHKFARLFDSPKMR
jgi:hypothetical protein